MAKNKKTVNAKKAEKREQSRFLNALEIILEALPERTREMVKMRYGIGFDDEKTLEEIGNVYKITRERVRQILKDSFRKIKKNAEHPVFIAVEKEIEFTVGKNNGIMKETDLIIELGGSNLIEKKTLLLFLELIEAVKLHESGDFSERVVIHKNFDLKKRDQVEKAVIEILENHGKTIEDKELYSSHSEKNPHLAVDYNEFFDYLIPSKKIGKNNFEKWGISTWNQVNPKVTWERAYLVLKEAKKPLHFREIAGLIDKFGLAKKKAHPQTVHNELIRNEKFVLIGRGIYALAEWGYKQGTVKDIIQDILKKKAKPMSREEILEEMLKLRKVKKSTILINLNNFFVRTGNDQYFVKR